MAQIDLKNAIIKILDGTSPTPKDLEVIIGEGNLTFSEKRNMEYKLNRGRIYGVREGDEVPVDVSMEFMWEFLRSAVGVPPTVEDALKKRGEAITWVSSGADPCEPYCVTIQIIYTPPCAGAQIETVTLNEFRYEELNHDLRGGTVSVTGKCNIKQALTTRG